MNGQILGFSDANDQGWQSDSSSDSYPIEMDLTPNATLNEQVSPAPKSNRRSKIRSPRRQKLSSHSAKPQGSWSPINAKGIIPRKLANRLKDKFRAEIVAGCRSQHFEECRRDTKALVDEELERMAKEHAEKLESHRTKAQKAIREAQGERMNELKTIRKLEQAKKAIEFEAEIKDQRIRDLEGDLQKSLATEGGLKERNATAEIALQKAQADFKNKAKQVRNQKMATETALKNAFRKITDLQAENAALKEQIEDVKKNLRMSTNKVKDLATTIAEQPPPTEANHQTEANQQAKSIRSLTSSVGRLTSIVAEQATSLANMNSTMMDYKNVNETLVKELASQRSEMAAAEDQAVRLLEMFYAERQKRENLEKQVQLQAADDDDELMAPVAPTDEVPTTESLTSAIIIQDGSPSSESSSLVIPTVASAPTSTTVGNIFDNLILLAYYFLFGNLFLTFSLLSLVILPGTQLFLSAFFDIFHNTDLAMEGETVVDTDTDKKIARMPGAWGFWEED